MKSNSLQKRWRKLVLRRQRSRSHTKLTPPQGIGRAESLRTSPPSPDPLLGSWDRLLWVIQPWIMRTRRESCSKNRFARLKKRKIAAKVPLGIPKKSRVADLLSSPRGSDQEDPEVKVEEVIDFSNSEGQDLDVAQKGGPKPTWWGCTLSNESLSRGSISNSEEIETGSTWRRRTGLAVSYRGGHPCTSYSVWTSSLRRQGEVNAEPNQHLLQEAPRVVRESQQSGPGGSTTPQ